MSTHYKNQTNSTVILRNLRKEVLVGSDIEVRDEQRDSEDLVEALERGWLTEGTSDNSDDTSEDEGTSDNSDDTSENDSTASSSNQSTTRKKASSAKASKSAPKSTAETDPGSGTSTDVSGS